MGYNNRSAYQHPPREIKKDQEQACQVWANITIINASEIMERDKNLEAPCDWGCYIAQTHHSIEAAQWKIETWDWSARMLWENYMGYNNRSAYQHPQREIKKDQEQACQVWANITIINASEIMERDKNLEITMWLRLLHCTNSPQYWGSTRKKRNVELQCHEHSQKVMRLLMVAGCKCSGQAAHNTAKSACKPSTLKQCKIIVGTVGTTHPQEPHSNWQPNNSTRKKRDCRPL